MVAIIVEDIYVVINLLEGNCIWTSLVKIFAGSLRIFKDLQRPTQIFKDLQRSYKDPQRQGSLKDPQRYHEDLFKIL